MAGPTSPCGGLLRQAKIRRLRVGVLFESFSPARVGLAGEKERGEALRAPQGIGLFEEREDRRRF